MPILNNALFINTLKLTYGQVGKPMQVRRRNQ